MRLNTLHRHSNKTLLFRRLLPRYILLGVCAALLVWLWHKLARLGLDYEWQWNRAWRQLGHWTKDGFKPGPLLDGLFLTIIICCIGMLCSIGVGLVLAIMRLSPWPFCKLFAKNFIRVWRGTPLLLQLFFVYFLISPLFSLSPLWSAILALGAFEGAYMAEIFRAAILSVPRQQWEAALSLGFGINQCLCHVILPQAIKNALPALASQTIALIKDTSLVSAIAVADLTLRAQAIVAETFLAFEVWLLAGLLYLLLALCVAVPGLWLEKRQSRQQYP